MPYLIYAPETPNQKVYELQSGIYTIGREYDNRIIVDEHTVSRHHAKIDAQTQILSDCGSTNRTFVNGQEIMNNHHLQDGDIIRFGLTIIFKYAWRLPDSQPPSGHPQFADPNIKQIRFEPNISVIQQLPKQKSNYESILKLKEQEEHKRIVQKLQILLEVSQQLCSSDDSKSLLNTILDLLFQIMDIDRAVILLVNEDSGQLEQKAFKLREGVPDRQPLYSQRIIDLVYQSGDAILTKDASRDERLKGSVSVLRESIHTSMAVPLKTFTDILGVLYVDNLSFLTIYSEEDLEFLGALANQAAAHVHLAREREKQQQKIKQHILELQIQIDHTKKEQEVDEIINSDFFRNLEQRVEKLRDDLF